MKRFFLLCLFAFSSLLAFATHLRGGFISVNRVSSLRCNITITVYTDNDCVGGCVLFGGELDVLDFGDGTQMLVPEAQSTPLLGFAGVGVAHFNVQHTYPGIGSYTVSFKEPNRNAGVLNMDNSMGTTFYVETTFDLANGFQSTPNFLLGPVFEAKVGSDLSLSTGAISGDDFILLYELGVPFSDRNTPVQNFKRPENMSLNPFTGLLTWDTQFNDQFQAGEFAVNIKVSLYKEIDGAFVSVCTISRDVQIILTEITPDVIPSANIELDANGRIYIPTAETKTIKVFFEKFNTESTVELFAHSELSSNEFTFSSYDSAEAPNIKVGVLTLTSVPEIDRENPYLVTVRGKFDQYAKDISFLLFTQDVQPKLTELVELITKTEGEQSVMDIYPNPFKESLIISLAENQIASISIQDQTGMLIHSQQVTGLTNLDVRNLNAGFYSCTVVSGSKIKRMKLFKN